MSEIESKWPTVRLGSLLTDIQPGFASGKHNSTGAGVPHFRPMNVSTDGRIERALLKYVDPSAGRSDLRLRRGDVVFNNTNSPELVGKTAFFDHDDTPAFSNHMTRLRTNVEQLDPEFLAIRLHQAWREGWFAAHCNNHVSQASIGRDVLKEFEIELPPIADQQRIARLYRNADASRVSASSHLTLGQRAIERFRQAVLAAACTGQLSVDWRNDNPAAPSVANALEQERGSRRRKGRGHEQSVDINLPAVPDTYAVATVGDAEEVIEYGTSQRLESSSGEGVPVLRMGNVQDGQLDMTDLKFHKLDREIEKLLLLDGDLLFNRTNSPELVGKSAVYHGHDTISFASYLIRVRFKRHIADPDFVNYWINSAWGRSWARLAKTDGVSQSNINGSKLGLMPLPLPPIEEQREIVRCASNVLQIADRLLNQIDRAAHQVDRSSQAILAKAFRGELTALTDAETSV